MAQHKYRVVSHVAASLYPKEVVVISFQGPSSTVHKIAARERIYQKRSVVVAVRRKTMMSGQERVVIVGSVVGKRLLVEIAYRVDHLPRDEQSASGKIRHLVEADPPFLWEEVQEVYSGGRAPIHDFAAITGLP